MPTTVAVDLDEVLGFFLSAVIEFHNDTFRTALRLEDFWSYTFREVWGGSEEEAKLKVDQFFQTSYFREGVKVVPGARDALMRLKSNGFRLVVVTSRQHVIADETRRWLRKHFDGIFEDVAFGNHWGREGRKVSKVDMCRELGATILIDDSLSYTTSCADAGVHCLLFDYKGLYRWNDASLLPPLVTRVKSWDEVCQHLL